MTLCRLQSNYSSMVILHGGPVVLHPVRATPCLINKVSEQHANNACTFLSSRQPWCWVWWCWTSISSFVILISSLFQQQRDHCQRLAQTHVISWYQHTKHSIITKQHSIQFIPRCFRLCWQRAACKKQSLPLISQTFSSGISAEREPTRNSWSP